MSDTNVTNPRTTVVQSPVEPSPSPISSRAATSRRSWFQAKKQSKRSKRWSCKAPYSYPWLWLWLPISLPCILNPQFSMLSSWGLRIQNHVKTPLNLNMWIKCSCILTYISIFDLYADIDPQGSDCKANEDTVFVRSKPRSPSGTWTPSARKVPTDCRVASSRCYSGPVCTRASLRSFSDDVYRCYLMVMGNGLL